MPRPIRWPVAALVLSVAVGCRPENARSSGHPEGTLPDIECDWRAEPEPRDAVGALCDLEFREITRLEGDPNGIIPQYPIMALWDGRYVTATYSHGQLALWASDGRFLNVMGNGRGQGPGEFTFAANFLQVEDDELLVFTSRGIVHRYSTTGRFLRSHLFHTGGGGLSATTYRGAVVTSGSTLDGSLGLALRGDSVRQLGILGRRESIVLLAGASDVGLWSAEYDRYVLRRHAWPSAAVEDSLIPPRDWSPGPEGNEAQLSHLHADDRGLIWTVVSVADPDAPRRRPGGAEQAIGDIDEFVANEDRFRDAVIEAFRPDGRLIASVRFDSVLESRYPMRGNIWNSPTQDLMSIVIWEAVLTRRR